MTNYVAYTLVDISNTNETKIQRNKLHFFQQQNLNTLIPTIGLRSQPLDIEVLPLMAQDVVKFGFGKQYQGLHTVWKLQFSIEHGGAIENMNNLLADCNGIPIYTGLEETAEISSKCFETVGPVNVCFKKHTDVR